MMRKRGQFTVLVVFGLLAVMAIAFALMFRTATTGTGLSQEVVNDFVASGTVKAYVGSCVEAVTGQGILLASLQGGNLWEKQTHITNNAEFETINISGQSLDVTLMGRGSMTATDCNVSKLNVTPPGYPLINSPMNGMTLSAFRERCTYYEDKNAGFFGDLRMRPLCERGGENWEASPQDEEADKKINKDVYRLCEEYGLQGDLPVQYQLQKYVEVNLNNCTKMEEIKNIEGVEVIIGTPDVKVLLGKEDVTVKTSYPVTAKADPDQVFTAFFETNVPVRFKELYEFFKDIMQREIQELEFDAEIDEDFRGSSFHRNGFRVERIECPYRGDDIELEKFCPLGYYNDIYRAIDSNSFFDGNPLTIYGVMENRRPVLEKIGAVDVEEEEESEVMVEFEFLAIDPDNDDELLMTYSKAEPMSDFEHEILAGMNANDEIIEDEKRLEKKTKARLAVDEDDERIGIINVTVWDESGLYDYQEFAVAVNDPVACGDNYWNEDEEQCEAGLVTIGCEEAPIYSNAYESGYHYGGLVTCHPNTCRYKFNACVRLTPVCGDDVKKPEETCEAGDIITCDEFFDDDNDYDGYAYCNDECTGYEDTGDCELVEPQVDNIYIDE